MARGGIPFGSGSRSLCLAAALALLAMSGAQQLQAQVAAPVPLSEDQTAEAGRGSVGVIDLERLFLESAFGSRVARDFEARRAALAGENRVIETQLIEEEQTLTRDRAGMNPADFRALADAFDEKVQRIRREQDAKVAALGQDNEAAQRLFLQAADPVLTRLMLSEGLNALLDRRYVLKHLDAVDITDEAIILIDAVIGAAVDSAAQEPAAPDAALGDTAPSAPASEGQAEKD